MPYYCKKCGAVVTGKFCSRCGTRVTSDLRDFRLAQNRLQRKLEKEAFEHDFPKYPRAYKRAAFLAAWLSFERHLPERCLNEDLFSSVKDECWRKLDLCEYDARIIYARIMRACYPEYDSVLNISRG